MYFMFFLFFYKNIFYCFYSVYDFLFLKTFIIYRIGSENHRIMLICKPIFYQIANELKIILPVPDNSVCFVLF